MTEFELLAIPLSLVLGLGVTTVLAAAVAGFRSRDERALHWLPNVWALLILAHQVHYFFVLWDLNERLGLAGDTWTWQWFGPAFLHATLFFLAAGLILPAERGASASQLEDFAKNGRYALAALFLGYLIRSTCTNTATVGSVRRTSGTYR